MSDLAVSVADLDEIYAEAIEAPAMAHTTEVTQPKAVFLGGQPGAGKSTMARSALKFFRSENFITVDVDRLRPLHPQYLPMVAKPETEALAPSAVQGACSRWADGLREAAVQKRRNVLLDGTMRDPVQVRASALAMRAAGYCIEAHVLAVHEESSAVSLRQRFENEKLILGFGRHMPPEYHTAAVKGIVDTIQTIEAEQLVDLLVVHDRAGHVIYQNRLVDGRWERDPDGASVVRDFRASSYTAEEKNDIAQQWAEVLEKMTRRGAGVAEVKEAQAAHAKARLIAQEANPSLPVEREFDGRITHVDVLAGTVTQKIGRDPAAVASHALSELTRKPNEGEVVNIKYRGGVGHVSDRQMENSMGR